MGTSLSPSLASLFLLHLWHSREQEKLLSSSPVPELQHGPHVTRDVLGLLPMPAVGLLSFTCQQGAATCGEPWQQLCRSHTTS